MRAGCRSYRSITCSVTSRRCASHPLGLEPPFACLLASGGHTLVLDVADYARRPRRLGGTRDDAAGEAFDKGARLLGLSEAGGAELERVARRRRPRALPVPPRPARSGGARSLVLGAQDRAPAPGARARRRLPDARGRPCGGLPGRDRRGSSPSAPRRRSTRPAATTLAVVGGVAANGALRARAHRDLRAARRAALPAAARAVRRQRRDDRRGGVRGACARAGRVPRARRLRAESAGRVDRRRAGRAGPWGRVPSAGHDAPPPLAHAHARCLARGSARRGHRAPRAGCARSDAGRVALVGRCDHRRPGRRAAAPAGDHRPGRAAGGRDRQPRRRRRPRRRRSSSTSTRSRRWASSSTCSTAT